MKKTNKAVRQPVESVMKRRWKNHHKPFGKSYKPLKVFAHPLKALRKPLKPLEKPLATRWLAVGFCPFNTKPLVYVFAWKVTKVPAHLESFWSSKAYANKIQFLWCLHHGYLSLIHVNKILVTPQPLSGILGKPAATEMNKRGFLKLLRISSVCRVKKLFPYHYFDGWATDKRQVICSLAYLDYRSHS